MINLRGHHFNCLPEGGLFWVNKETLIISDLHLEKGSSFFKEGQFISPNDTFENLRKLEDCINKSKPKIIIFLGDTFHDKESLKRISDKNLKKFKELFLNLKSYFISGNHDENIIHEDFDFINKIDLDGIRFIHKKTNSKKFEISGHFHPVATIKYKGLKIKNKCFLFSDNKIILPSFGTYTGGINVKDKNFNFLKKNKCEIFIIMNEKIVKFKFSQLF